MSVKGTTPGRDTANYLIEKAAVKFPEFSNVTDDYNSQQHICLTSTKPNQFGDIPQINFYLSDKGLEIITLDVPYPEDEYSTDPREKREEIEDGKIRRFKYFVWEPTVGGDPEMDRSFSLEDTEKAHEMIDKSFEVLKKFLDERLN